MHARDNTDLGLAFQSRQLGDCETANPQPRTWILHGSCEKRNCKIESGENKMSLDVPQLGFERA